MKPVENVENNWNAFFEQNKKQTYSSEKNEREREREMKTIEIGKWKILPSHHDIEKHK